MSFYELLREAGLIILNCHGIITYLMLMQKFDYSLNRANNLGMLLPKLFINSSSS